MKKKPKIVIVEGAQGGGKTTLTNILRDMMPYSNLMRLSGIKDKSEEARPKVVNIYYSLMQMLYSMKGTEMNWIFDRTFFSERVYCMLGYKDYDFKEDYDYFLMSLAELSEYYDIYLFVLVADEKTYEERLNRDKPQFGAVKFGAENSMRQQEAYLELMKEVNRNYPRDIQAYLIQTINRDPYDIAYDIIEGMRMN